MKKLINYLSKKSLSLGNGSGMTRKWFGNDSGMTRFSLASLICLCMLTIGVGNVWGAEGDKHNFSQSLSQLLNNNASISSINIAEQSYPVKEVIISFRYNKTLENAVTMTVSVGGDSWGSKYCRGTGSNYTDTSYTHSAASGAIVISFTNNTGSGTGHGTFYVNNICLVEGASGGGCDKTVTLNYDGDASGLHGSFVLKAGSASGSTIAEGGTTANCGSGTTSVVVVPTPDEHYHVASVSATNKTGTISGPDGDGNYTISYTQGSNITSTVTVGFEEDTKYTVTWMSNGSQHTTTQVYSGEKPTFPSNPSSCDGTSTAFYGWATATWTGKLNDVSSKTIYLSGDAMPAVSGAVTYYAVFAKESATAFEKITSADNIYVGQKIAIVSNKQDYILPSNFNATTAATHPNSNDNKLTVTSSQVWTITDIDEYGYYKLKNSTTQMGVNRTSGLTSGSAAVGNSSTVASWWAINETTDFDYTVDDCFYMYNWATATYYNFLENSGSSWLSYYAADITSGNKVWYAMKLYQPERSEFLTTCCTALGSINGSVNLSTSSTGTSVSVSVLTEGVNAYGDANNVSGYDFKLYTASAGGSAAATYSSDSKAGTSHTFTELTPLTQYWVTVRPIGSGSYCNTTAESDRVAIYTCPGSPNHVDVSGRWDRFGGETISLTAAAYATDGTGTAIPAAKITGYQWQKWYNSQWNNISNAGTTSGATTNNLQITNCSNENSGSYRCVVSTVAGCDIASDGFQVKVYALECYNSGTTVYNFTRTGDTQAGTVQIDLSASTNYGYKVHADNDYYGNSGTVNEDVVNWEMSTGVSNNLTVASGLGGTFTFAIDYSTGGNNSTEGIPEISVTYPRKTIYLTPGVWNTGGAKFAFYYFRKVDETIYGEGFTDFITADDCGSYADIPQWNGVKINAVRLNSNTTASDLTNSANHYKAAWDKKWNQTSDITITNNNSISITGWGPDNGDSPYDYGTYAVPTYTISYATGSVPTGGGSISGSKANETKTCGVDFDLPAAQFTTTGYVQTGWSKADGGAQYAAVSGSYTDNSAQTFYPVWTANTHTLTWDKNGGDALTGDYTSGTVAYATTITAPNTPTWTGHRFDGWDNGSGVVTPATTMPDNDLTYTAQWSLATYTVTLNTNGGTINAGNVTSYTYGTGATLPTNVTRDGYRFDGWFSDDGVWSDQVTAISTTATGDKTYYAKWTQVYTVTWSVNGDTWSSGVVEGNTHVPGGSKVSALPTAPTKSDCDDSKVFVGWRATAIAGTSASDPGGIFTNVAGSPEISAKTTFYAVFADAGKASRTTLYEEPFKGTAGSNTDWASAGDYFDNANTASITTTTSWKVSKYTTECSDNDGASGGSHMFCGSASGNIIFNFGNKSTYTDLVLSFNYRNNAGGGLDRTISCTVSGDGGESWSDNIIDVASVTTQTWNAVSYNVSNSSTSALQVKWTATAANPSRVDDIKLTGCLITYSNYVTSCSSCDADATFTNTTPAVSAIECTSATLTATGGLATLGADGCHVSDYGFVIGTSDNPAIGGSGVEKLQVGTSDPTIGEDFSYDATGLTKGTHYYIRAYAKNGHGTAYSTNSQNFWTKNVSSIAITTAPTKTNYIVGETFDATGMVVTATMASGATEDVTSDVTYSTDPLTSGTNKDFAINYTLCETDKSVNQKINVYTLSVSEGTNQSYGSYTVDGAVITVSLEAQKTFSFATTNCSTRDNGDGTYTVINVTGNATVVINYRNAVQVKVYYKVDGTTITSLTQDVYESSQTTLPTASALSSAMAAQGMALPDELYPNFIGWSETEFGAQTADPTIVEGTPVINAEKNYYAVYSNVNKIRIDESDITSTSYPGSEQTLTKSSKDFKYHYVCKNSTYYLQFKKNSTQFGYIYNNTAIGNITKIEVGASGDNDFVPVYAGSAANTITGSALTDENTSETKYIYLFPSNTQYFIIKGDNSYTYKVNYIDIYYASSTVYYMTQFCTRYAVTGASTGGTAVIVNGNTGGTLTSSHNELCEGKNLTLSATVNTQYSFGEWKIVKTGAEPEVDLTADLLGANKTSLTPPAFAMPGYGITVSATISEKTATAWSWTYNSAAIPDPMILYVGEVKQLDVTYTPDASQLVADQKNYSVDKESSVAQVSKTANYYRMRGAAGVTVETNTAVTFSLNSLSQVVNVTVRPLPSATFEDNVHNAVSTTVTATVTDGVVSLTKKTPTHADVAAPVGGNECETTHLHLVGWIDGDWEPFINYMNGGSRPSDSDITTATGYFYLPNADIDLSQKGGKTYYAVWGKVDE